MMNKDSRFSRKMHGNFSTRRHSCIGYASGGVGGGVAWQIDGSVHCCHSLRPVDPSQAEASVLGTEKTDFRQRTVACIDSAPGHPGSALEPLVLELVSTPARGNENSWEAVESRTARHSETDEETGRVVQG
ncbi:cAMP-specific 3',5'-cyclic phosphodiesterase 4C isoform X5 [Lates japonicus]|uniref:cAMP-specific 3',5'-cyclic phosphodiesterase 4C isoform X5 n=1 Tax=Lates japonicus TaxID=270547 RepID=A0AAD3NCE1_LATJO|nr:cAMP-specific 3',5'-cyclic phosphodiesterase 4C isoform X5 [Lates japonicus]